MITLEELEKRLQKTEQKLVEKLEKIEKLFYFKNCITEQNYFDNQDLCQLLNISKATLQRYRSMGLLKYQKIGKKIFYTQEHIQEFINNNNKKIEL